MHLITCPLGDISVPMWGFHGCGLPCVCMCVKHAKRVHNVWGQLAAEGFSPLGAAAPLAHHTHRCAMARPLDTATPRTGCESLVTVQMHQPQVHMPPFLSAGMPRQPYAGLCMSCPPAHWTTQPSHLVHACITMHRMSPYVLSFVLSVQPWSLYTLLDAVEWCRALTLIHCGHITAGSLAQQCTPHTSPMEGICLSN